MQKKRLNALSLCFLLLSAALMLTACKPRNPGGGNPAMQKEVHADFIVNGQVFTTQTVQLGSYWQAVRPEIDGLAFLYWTDFSGQPVNPESVVSTGDMVFTAVGYPKLTSHSPFLFVDKDGALRPEDPLTRNDVQAAFNALAAPGAANYFPQMPAGDDAYTSEEMFSLALHFFPKTDVAKVLTPFGSRTLTRGDLAVILCQLLHRDEETVLPDDGVTAPTDLRQTTKNLSFLLEASIPHTVKEGGITWEQYPISSGFQPGFLHKNGYLYYVKEDGYFLQNDKLGTLEFGPTGCYTSGDSELDQQVAQILMQIFGKNPGKSRDEMLYQVYLYCRDTFRQQSGSPYKMGATGWEIQDAKDAFSGKPCSCYNYTAAFWALARGLGYETEAVSGTRGKNPAKAHSWVFLTKDDKVYICDCAWEAEYRIQQGRYDVNMFMLPAENHAQWNYQWKKN